MKTTTSNQNALKFVCDIIGHRYEMSKKVTSHVKEYTCKCCNHQLTTDSKGNLTALTPKYQEINRVLERIYNSKRTRLKEKSHTSSIYELRNIA